MVPHKVSFVERLFLSQRIPYQRFHKIVDRKLSACDTLSNQTISLSLYTQCIPPPSPTYYYMIHILLPLQTQSQPTHNQPTSQQSYIQQTLISSMSPSSYILGGRRIRIVYGRARSLIAHAYCYE